MSKDKINIALSTLNFYFIIIGYAFATTLLLPVSGDSEMSRGVTLPFRAFTLAISLVVILINKPCRYNKYIKLLLVFWVVYLLKLFWVISVTESTVAAHLKSNQEYYFYSIGVVFIPMISVINSYKKIDINGLIRTTYMSGIVILLISIVNNNILGATDVAVDLNESRQNANMALNTISYGHIAIMVAIISLYNLLRTNNHGWMKLLFIAGLLIGLYASFRAASRSPIVAFVFVSVILIITSVKNKERAILASVCLVLATILLGGVVGSIIESVSPVMSRRLEDMREGESSYRDLLYVDAWGQFLDFPIFGGDFVLTKGYGLGYYPHNIVLESLMTLGFLGGIVIIILLVKAIYAAIKNLSLKRQEGVVCAIFLQYMIMQMFSGNIYTSNIFFGLFAFTLCTINKNKSINIYEKNLSDI